MPSRPALRAAALTGVAIGLVRPVPVLAQAAPQPPPTVTLITPEMDGTLAFTAPPNAIDTGKLGTWYVDAALTGLGLAQGARVQGDRSTYGDLSNAQIFIQKIDGFFQFFAQAGFYSIPSLGVAYSPDDASHAIHNSFDAVPQAFVKLVPNANFFIEAGKLPTLIGPESTFTFENMNIERGLLWNQEPAISRGVQASYIAGAMTFNISVNDGYYSDRLNWVSGSAVWTIDAADTLNIDGGGNLGHTAYQATATVTPIAQNNSTIGTIGFIHNATPWIVTPYLQYSRVPAIADLGLRGTTQSFGAALLVSYAFNKHVSLAGRAEFLATGGGTAHLLYGPGSNAASLTATPTYMLGRYYVRAEGSWVHASDITAGDGFGAGGNKTNQWRGLLEGGVLF